MRDEILNFVFSCETAAGNRQLPVNISKYQLAVKNVIQGKELSEEVLIYCGHVKEFVAKLGGREDLASKFNLIRRKLKQTFALNSKLKEISGVEGLALLRKHEFESNTATYSILIGKEDLTVEQALELFEEMKTAGTNPDVVTYNYLIAKDGISFEQVEELLENMQQFGVTPNEGTIGTIRGSSVENGKSALIGLAQSLIDQAENRGANFAAQGVS